MIASGNVEADHIAALENMPPEQRLALSREILAAYIRFQGHAKGVLVTRVESLQAVFEAEANAVNHGARANTDFLLPITSEFPIASA